MSIEVHRLENLGASRVTPTAWQEFGQKWFVLADPEGNEFCVDASPIEWYTDLADEGVPFPADWHGGASRGAGWGTSRAHVAVAK